MKTIRIILISLLVIIFSNCKNEVKNEYIKIGVILPLSGNMANYGKSIRGALKAMEFILNEKRKEEKAPLLKLIFEDNKLEVKEGINAINKLITTDKVLSIIGPFSSSITLGVTPIAEANRIVLITPGATSTDITKAGDYIFRTILSGEYEAKVSASIYKKSFINSKLAIIFINNEYGVSLKNNFIRSINTDNFIEVPYDANTTNFNSYLTKIKKNKCEVVYLIGYNEMKNIFHQAEQLDLNVKWIGTAQLASERLVSQIGKPANGVILPTWELNTNTIKQNNPDFYKKFLELSENSELDAFAINSIDALLALNKVYGSNQKITSAELKNKLYKLNFKGISGNFSFDSNGDVIKKMEIKIIKNGKFIDYKP